MCKAIDGEINSFGTREFDSHFGGRVRGDSTNNSVGNGLGIFVAGVFGGNNEVVGKYSGNLAHQGSFGSITVPRGAKNNQEFFSGFFLLRQIGQNLLESVGGMGKINVGVQVSTIGDSFEATLDTREGREGALNVRGRDFQQEGSGDRGQSIGKIV